MTEPPSSATYSTVVTWERSHNILLIVGLYNLNVKSANIYNKYLNVPCQENIWILAGPELVSNEGTVMVVVREWYGIKSSGAS